MLPQVKEFNYLGVLFTIEGKVKGENDRLIAAVMQASCKSDVLKRELSVKEKLFTYRWTCLASKLSERLSERDTSGGNEIAQKYNEKLNYSVRRDTEWSH